MDEVLVVIIQFVVEFILNVGIDIPFEWPSRHRSTPEPESVAGVCVFWLILGGALAGISLLIFPRTIVSLHVLRIANLLLAPVASGLLSFKIAQRRARANPNIRPRNHFWQAFWFTIGWVAIRFAYAGHT